MDIIHPPIKLSRELQKKNLPELDDRNKFEMFGRQVVLAAWIRVNKWNRGAELGVHRGTTFMYLLEMFPDLKMIGVDQWKEIKEGTGGKFKGGYRDYIGQEIEKWGAKVRADAEEKYPEQASFLHMDTLSAAELVVDESLDFIFIDADHRESFVRADIAAWVPKVRKEGMIFGHDCNEMGVQRAISSLLPGWLPYYGTVWYIPRADVRFC